MITLKELNEQGIKPERKKKKKPTVGFCDPCSMAREDRTTGREEFLIPDMFIQVDEQGVGQYMILTQDGRTVPVEDYY